MLVFTGGSFQTAAVKIRRYSYEDGGFLLLGDTNGQVLLRSEEINELKKLIELYQEKNLSVVHHADEAQRVVDELIRESQGAEAVAVVTSTGELIREQKADVFGRLAYRIRQGSSPVGLVGCLNLKGEMRFYCRPLPEFSDDQKIQAILQDGLREFAREVLK